MSMCEVHCLQGDAPATPSLENDLAATLASRICHDLTSPLGAIANGVELLSLSGAERTPEMDLIAESVDSANARLRFFRLAYGVGGSQPIGRAEVTRTLAALGRMGRIAYDWTAEGDHPRDEVKAVFLLIQCLEASLPMGGRIRVAREGGTWDLSAEGPRLKVALPAWEALAPSPAPLPQDAALVQFTLLQGLLAAIGRKLDLNLGPDRIKACF